MGSWREYAAWFLTMPLAFLNPLVLAQDLSQWLGTAVAFVRHRGTFPAVESYDQQVSYRLPFDGTWTVVNGSYDHDYSHSWFPVTQRYAYDFVITDADGRTSPAGSGSAVDSYYCYDEPILAPADGVVVDVFDTDVESPRGGGLSHPLKRDIRGSYVVIQHAPTSTAVSPIWSPAAWRSPRGPRRTRTGDRPLWPLRELLGATSPFPATGPPRFELAAGLRSPSTASTPSGRARKRRSTTRSPAGLTTLLTLHSRTPPTPAARPHGRPTRRTRRTDRRGLESGAGRHTRYHGRERRSAIGRW